MSSIGPDTGTGVLTSKSEGKSEDSRVGLTDYADLCKNASALRALRQTIQSSEGTSAAQTLRTKARSVHSMLATALASIPGPKPPIVGVGMIEPFGDLYDRKATMTAKTWEDLFTDAQREMVLEESVRDFCDGAVERLEELVTNLSHITSREQREAREAYLRQLEPHTAGGIEAIHQWSQSLRAPRFKFTNPSDLLISLREIVTVRQQRSLSDPVDFCADLAILANAIKLAEGERGKRTFQRSTRDKCSADSEVGCPNMTRWTNPRCGTFTSHIAVLNVFHFHIGHPTPEARPVSTPYCTSYTLEMYLLVLSRRIARENSTLPPTAFRDTVIGPLPGEDYRHPPDRKRITPRVTHYPSSPKVSRAPSSRRQLWVKGKKISGSRSRVAQSFFSSPTNAETFQGACRGRRPVCPLVEVGVGNEGATSFRVAPCSLHSA